MLLNHDIFNFYNTLLKKLYRSQELYCEILYFKYILSIWSILLELFYSCLKGLIWKKKKTKTLEAEMPTFIQYKHHTCEKKKGFIKGRSIYVLLLGDLLF